jgi:hypothetical protein
MDERNGRINFDFKANLRRQTEKHNPETLSETLEMPYVIDCNIEGEEVKQLDIKFTRYKYRDVDNTDAYVLNRMQRDIRSARTKSELNRINNFSSFYKQNDTFNITIDENGQIISKTKQKNAKHKNKVLKKVKIKNS